MTASHTLDRAGGRVASSREVTATDAASAVEVVRTAGDPSDNPQSCAVIIQSADKGTRQVGDTSSVRAIIQCALGQANISWEIDVPRIGCALVPAGTVQVSAYLANVADDVRPCVQTVNVTISEGSGGLRAGTLYVPWRITGGVDARVAIPPGARSWTWVFAEPGAGMYVARQVDAAGVARTRLELNDATYGSVTPVVASAIAVTVAGPNGTGGIIYDMGVS